jgi:hypothetical protein
MGLDFGLESWQNCNKRKFRWLFKIPEISASGVQSLPPSKAARPTVSFKETPAEHLNETIYLPVKPEWKTIDLTLYDLKRDKHPIFEWVQRQYDPCEGKWYKPFENGTFKLTATLELYDGCGETMETWIIENVWPQNANFDDLDMGDSMYLTCVLTLRYDRAYILENC